MHGNTLQIILMQGKSGYTYIICQCIYHIIDHFKAIWLIKDSDS